MSTRSTLWYGSDEKGRVCHIFWELGERIPYGGVPIYLELEVEGRELLTRLPKETAQELRNFLDPKGFDPI
jgi:hypothetical protein